MECLCFYERQDKIWPKQSLVQEVYRIKRLYQLKDIQGKMVQEWVDIEDLHQIKLYFEKRPIEIWGAFLILKNILAAGLQALSGKNDRKI